MITLALLLAIAIGFIFFDFEGIGMVIGGIAAGIILSVMLYKIYDKQCDIKQELDFLVLEKNKENKEKEEKTENNTEEQPNI